MATTREDIQGWLERGSDQHAEFMLVVCDTFDYEDYPVYCKKSELDDCKLKHSRNMQKIMEVYDLSKNREKQLKQRRNDDSPG